METLIRYGGSYIIDDLIAGRMSVSDARGFNDPFELHFTEGKPLSEEAAWKRIRRTMESPSIKSQIHAVMPGLSVKEIDQVLQQHSKVLIDSFRSGDRLTVEGLREEIFTITDEACKIVCCTEPNVDDSAENAMWAYYATNHTGVRFHLHESHYGNLQRWFKICYVDSPPVYESSDLDGPDKMLEFAMAVVGSKSPAWAHEKEVRLLIPLGATYEADDGIGSRVRCYTPLMPGHVVRVDLGIRCTVDEKKISELLMAFPCIEVHRAEKQADSYKIVYRRIY